jgi:hypothetical protein
MTDNPACWLPGGYLYFFHEVNKNYGILVIVERTLNFPTTIDSEGLYSKTDLKAVIQSLR